LGQPHRVTSALGPVILALDGRPALEVMTEELGDLFRRAGDRFAPSLWLAEGEEGEGGTPRVRRVTIADRERGALRVEDGRRVPGAVRLMRPDPAAALARVVELARTLKAELAAHPITAGIYLASRHRGPALFGPQVDELAVLRAELGATPLIGLVTDAEIFGGALHEASGVLLLIGEDGVVASGSGGRS
jgi:small ligand-binding sensory domain FIST